MKFPQHSVEAVGVCVHCGRALCPQCLSAPAPARLVCSAECAAALARAEEAMAQLLRRSAQSASASAFYCYLCAALSAGAAIAAWFMLPSPFLIYFTGACALAFAASGLWYGRGAARGRKNP